MKMLKFYLAIVACAFAVVASEETAGEEQFSQFFTTQYKLTEGDDKDYVNALKTFGINEAIINVLKSAKQIVVLTHTGAGYNLKIGESISQTFTLDTQKDENLYGIELKCTFHAEDADTLIETIEKDGKELKMKWDFSAEELKCEVSCDGITANRVYKKKPVESSASEQFSQFLAIQYELSEGDDEDYVNALKAFGVNEAIINAHKAAKPTVVLTHTDAEYNLKIGESISQTFTLDTQKDENLFGVDLKCTFHAEDADTLIETFEKDGKELKLKWDFSAEELKCEVSCDGVTANRVYTKKTVESSA